MSGFHGQDDIVLLFLEFQDHLEPGELILDAEVDGGGGTEKIHRFRTGARPGTYIFEIKARLFLLKKYSHTLLGGRRELTSLAEPIPRAPPPPAGIAGSDGRGSYWNTTPRQVKNRLLDDQPHDIAAWDRAVSAAVDGVIAVIAQNKVLVAAALEQLVSESRSAKG